MSTPLEPEGYLDPDQGSLPDEEIDPEFSDENDDTEGFVPSAQEEGADVERPDAY